MAKQLPDLHKVQIIEQGLFCVCLFYADLNIFDICDQATLPALMNNLPVITKFNMADYKSNLNSEIAMSDINFYG
jgi:hypothetical protein